ncbi:hypothetical protein [Herbaspirillum sp. 3C11]|uniref:hypothetical protein n=1 Tax=Herbaspirillum sp. 3C11 TaxID=2559615 RepID=UPI001ADB5570|nr:hypothetical protein [Herbaspirillum sp. 3C11]
MMATKIEKSQKRDYWGFYRNGMSRMGWCLTCVAIMVLIIALAPDFSRLDERLLHLLRWMGTNCVWCSITPN